MMETPNGVEVWCDFEVKEEHMTHNIILIKGDVCAVFNQWRFDSYNILEAHYLTKEYPDVKKIKEDNKFTIIDNEITTVCELLFRGRNDVLESLAFEQGEFDVKRALTQLPELAI